MAPVCPSLGRTDQGLPQDQVSPVPNVDGRSIQEVARTHAAAPAFPRSQDVLTNRVDYVDVAHGFRSLLCLFRWHVEHVVIVKFGIRVDIIRIADLIRVHRHHIDRVHEPNKVFG